MEKDRPLTEGFEYSQPPSFDRNSVIFGHKDEGNTNNGNCWHRPYYSYENHLLPENRRHIFNYQLGSRSIEENARHHSSYHFYGRPQSVRPPLHAYPVHGIRSWVTDIKPNDVLSGRGGATNSHSGNRAFRLLVKRYQDQYLKAKKRDKPTVASIIVEKIRSKGGRFLRRFDQTARGEIVWTDIGDDRAREKTCQALREGAPELRKKRKATSVDEGDAKINSSVTLSSSSSIDVNTPFGEDMANSQYTSGYGSPLSSRGSQHMVVDHVISPREEPIMIRPSAMLTKFSFSEAIPIDRLEPHERELYLRDFLPPNPAACQKKDHSQLNQSSILYPDFASPYENEGPWPIVEV